jgi:hypothetical protein
MKMILPTPQDFLCGISLDYCNIETKIEQLSFAYQGLQANYGMPDNVIELRYTFHFQEEPRYVYITLKCSNWNYNVNSSEIDVYRAYIVQVRCESNTYYGIEINSRFMEEANKLIREESSIQNVMRIVNLYLETFVGGNHNNIDPQKITDYYMTKRPLFAKKDKVDAELHRIRQDFE